MKLWCMRHAYTIVFLFLSGCLFGYSIGGVYGFSMLPDEFGYWFYAAAAAGYDWSGILALNSYYSFGYSFILFPIFVLFRDGVAAYRAAVAVNFALLAGTGLMLCCLTEGVFHGGKRQGLPPFAVAAAVYPPLVMYTKTTMTETLLTFLYVLFCLLLYQYLENRKIFKLSALLVVLVYIHFVHMRTVSMLAAGVLSVLIDRLLWAGGKERSGSGRRYLLYFMVTAAMFVLFIAGIMAKNGFLDWIYGGHSELAGKNDYFGQLMKLQYIMTWEGLGNLIVSIAGKILYLGLATFGTAFWGLWYAWKAVVHGSERKGRVFWCFILLSAAGALMVNAVYMIRPGRVDTLTYGRYHEYVFPVLMAAGFYEMWHSRRLWKGTFLIAGIDLCMLVPVLWSLYKYHQTKLYACMVFGISYLYDAGDGPVRFYLKAFGFGLILLGMVTFLVAVSRRKENRAQFLFWVVILEIALVMRASDAVTDAGRIGAYRDTVIADRITELIETDDVGKVIYLDSRGDSAVGIMQFLLRDVPIKVLDRRKTLEDYEEYEMGRQDLVLMDYRDDFGSELSKRYERVLSSGHFILYYNRTGAGL